MIRLTLAQIRMAEIAADEVRETEYKRDRVPAGEFLSATVGPTRENPMAPCLEVKVPRAAVIAKLNERRDIALETLKALGIDFDPAG